MNILANFAGTPCSQVAIFSVRWQRNNFWKLHSNREWKVAHVAVAYGQTWRSGHCYLNKGECNLNQSKDDSFVEQVAKNNSWNNGDRHKSHEISLMNCFVFVITLVWKTVLLFSGNSPCLAGWTKKPFGHYAIMNLFSLRSPRNVQHH